MMNKNKCMFLIIHLSAAFPAVVFLRLSRQNFTFDQSFEKGSDLFFFLESVVSITDTGWHYIAGIFKSGMMILFIDDTRVDCVFPETPVPSRGEGFIGGKSFFDGTESFAGEIDEVRISNTVRTSDWIKLNYMNQKFGDALTKWN
jgi:hypothetical protein